MNNKFCVDRELRDIADPKLRSREYYIKKIQASYNYDRENAEKIYEMLQVRQIEFMWGALCGGFVAYKMRPI